MDENPYKSPHAQCNLPSDEGPPQRRFVDDLTPVNLAILAILVGAAWYSMDAFGVAVWMLFGSIAVMRGYRYIQERRRLGNR
jgi:hypothetical protein